MPKKKPFVLKLTTYFHPDRPHISASMVKDYLKSPDFYRRKYVEKSLSKFEPTKAMILGSFVDAKLTNPGEAKRFRRRIMAKDDRELYEEQKLMDQRYLLSEEDLDKGLRIASFVASQPFWNDGLKDAVMQLPLEALVDGTKVCGLPDRMDWNEDHTRLRIVDLKCVSPQKVASPQKWLWNAHDMGYLTQFAMYRLLACETYGLTRDQVDCAHAAVSYHEEGLVTANLYSFPKRLIDRAENQLLRVLDGIREKRFPKPSVTWEDAYDMSGLVPDEDVPEDAEAV